MRLTTRAAVLVLVFTLAGTARALAQEPSTPPSPPLDVAVEFAMMNEEYLDRLLPAGWIVSVQRHLNTRWALVGEANGAYWGQEAFPEFFPYAAWVHSILSGPRLKLPLSRNTTLFGQALGGWVRRTRTNPGSIIAPENEGNVDTFGIQPGLGFDYRFHRLYAVRLQGDYRWLKSTSVTQRSTNQTRIAAGMVIGVERAP
jgi:hypothetical protein